MEPDIIKLLVIENMMLQPSMDVYILPLPPTEVKGHRTRSHHTRHQFSTKLLCVGGVGGVGGCGVWIIVSLLNNTQSYICLCRISCAEPVSMTIRLVIGHMPDFPLLTQTNNHNI